MPCPGSTSRRVAVLGAVALGAAALLDGTGARSPATLAITQATPEATPAPPSFDLEDVLGALGAAGLTAEATDESVTQSFLTEPGRIVLVEGKDLQIYLYPTSEARLADVTIAPDGSPDPEQTIIIEWVATPHAFGVGNVLVLFVSDDAALAAAIERGLATLAPEPGPVVTPVPGEDAPGPPRTLDDVVAALEAAGLTVAVTGDGGMAFVSVPAKLLTVEGQPFEVYVYPTAADRVAETAVIRGDGSEVGPVIIDWIAPPHWAAANNVLTLLLTDDEDLVARVAAAILGLV